METRTVGYWEIRKDKLKQKFPEITNEDLNFYQGKEKEMVEVLGYKLGKSIREMRDIIISL